MQTLLMLLSLVGCGGQSGENPLRPSGPHVDFTALTGEVEAVFSGTHPGGVHDGGGEEACAIDGAEFVVETEIGSPIGCTDNDDSTVDSCEDATEAGFTLDGSIDFGDGTPLAFSGSVGIWSEEEGLMLFKSLLTPPEGDYPHQNLDLLVDGTMLDEAVFTGLSWTRRLSTDEDEITIWEMCTLAFTL